MITLFQDKVLLRAKKEEQKSIIELPENTISYEPFLAEVLETGPGKVNVEVDTKDQNSQPRINVKGSAKISVKKGDTVLVKRNVDYPIKINGEWLTIVKESDILGVIEYGG